MKTEFIYEKGFRPQSHASTIVETPQGLVCAWFAGTRERDPDVEIFVSRQENGNWTEPESVAVGIEPDGKRYGCWNPVLFQVPDGELLLFYKVGPTCPEWWGMMKRSADNGRTWGEPERLPDGIFGPIKNKPVLHPDGRLLCGASGESTGWCIHLEVTRDWGKSWETDGHIHSGEVIRAIQPSILMWSEEKIEMVGRTDNSIVFQIWSEDGGKTWGDISATNLPNPNSGTDAVMLKDGRALIVYNHVGKKKDEHGPASETWGPRSPLDIAVSSDGKEWNKVITLETEKGEYSYPAVIETSDGMIHITYTYKRETIKHVVLSSEEL